MQTTPDYGRIVLTSEEREAFAHGVNTDVLNHLMGSDAFKDVALCDIKMLLAEVQAACDDQFTDIFTARNVPKSVSAFAINSAMNCVLYPASGNPYDFIPPEFSKEFENLVHCIARKELVNSVKAYRTLTRADLRAAKEWVETTISRWPDDGLEVPS